jgi:PadR family transcriptional regulator, regulatory protein AphA
MKELNQSQYALLGLLSLGPMSGYDLKQLSEWSVGHFWREGYGQIYPSLKRLSTAGLVKKKTEANAGRPDRHVYTLTAAGRKEVEAWLRVAAAPQVPRSELLLKVFFGGLVPAKVSAQQVRKRMAECERELEDLKATQARIEREAGQHPQKPFWLMTLSYGEHMARAQMEWCEETLKKLEKLKQIKKKR